MWLALLCPFEDPQVKPTCSRNSSFARSSVTACATHEWKRRGRHVFLLHGSLRLAQLWGGLGIEAVTWRIK